MDLLLYVYLCIYAMLVTGHLIMFSLVGDEQPSTHHGGVILDTERSGGC